MNAIGHGQLLEDNEVRSGHQQCRQCENKSKREKKHLPNTRYASCRRNAKRDKVSFELTFEQFVAITSKTCHYCGEYTKDKDFCRHRQNNSWTEDM